MDGSSFVIYVKDMLAPLRNFTFKAMFGGYGIYQDGLIFGLIINDELYFKADKASEKFYLEFDSAPFEYEGKNGMVKMNYWRVPSEVLEDEDLLEKWYKVAIEVATRSKKDSNHKK
jgi:DNA transformation protein